MTERPIEMQPDCLPRQARPNLLRQLLNSSGMVLVPTPRQYSVDFENDPL
jgi:hypothetical protein